MDLAGWRNIALFVIAIIYIILTLAVLAIAGAVWYFGRTKVRGRVVKLINQKVRPVLDRVEQQALSLRDATARLPGNTAIGAGQLPARQKRGRLPFPLPFRRRRRIPFLRS